MGQSNNDPVVISSYYLKYVEKYGFTARVIRADMGTENVNVAVVQRFFRRVSDDAFAAFSSTEKAYPMSELKPGGASYVRLH